MKQALLFLLIFLGFGVFGHSQESLLKARRKSHETLVYRIPADTAEKYLQKGMKEVDHYLQAQPVFRFHADSVDYDKLPTGNYIILSVLDSMIEAKYYCSTRILPYVVNNQVQPQLLLRNEAGELFKNATVEVNGKPARFNAASSTYFIADKKADEAFVRIELPGDTLFAEIAIEKENYYTLKEQRRARFRSTKAGRIITWLPDRIKGMFDGKKRRRYNNRSQGKGYVIFNKPKYFPSDTIKFKAYLLDKKGRQYKKEIETHLVYYNRSSNINRKLADLKPASPGAYVYEFATGDTLPNDTRYVLQFRNKKGRPIFSSGFNIEDYLLDEVATYSVKSREENYYAGDTLEFSAIAKDANGLAVMDGRVELILVTQQIKNFYKRKVFVPDTLWRQEKVLAVEGDTKFFIPTGNFPAADMGLRAIAIFRNSNNEVQQKQADAGYIATNSKIDIRVENGLVKAVLYINGAPVTGKGFMETDLTTEPVPVVFPYAGKIDPQSANYEFYTADEEVWDEHEVEENYTINFNRGQVSDTVAFSLYNPNRIPVYYSLFDKDKEIFSASSNEERIIWKGKIPDNKIYYLRWQYYWAGEQQYGNESLALLSKLASAEIGGASAVYPGQTDTITVKVKDYKQRELKNVNLTAVSYNTQFAADIRVPEPPYIQKFKGQKPLLYDWYEVESAEAAYKFSLGKHQGWRKVFNLDTMAYYQFLFPEKHYRMVKTRIRQLMPQASVYVVQNGVPQEVFLVYMNRQLVYYNGVTDKATYATTRFPGSTQFIIRLKDKYILSDSIYLQPYYKHDIVFDLDKQGANYKVVDTVNFWTKQEKDILNSQVLRVENNYRNNNGYIWQDDKAYYLGSSGEHIVGPFINFDSLQFYKPGDFDFRFMFEPGYRYRVTPQMVRLERTPLLSPVDKVLLSAKGGPWWPLGDTLKELPVISYEKKKGASPFLDQYGHTYGSSSGPGKLRLQVPYDSTIVFTVLQDNNVDSNYRVLWGRTEMLYNLAKGNYTAVLVTSGFRYLEAANILVDSQGTYCVKFVETDTAAAKPVYHTSNRIIERIMEWQAAKRARLEEAAAKTRKEEEAKEQLYKQPQMTMQSGSGLITGRVVDKKGGDPIVGASVYIKGYNKGAVTGPDGRYNLGGIKAGQYVLIIASVGYAGIEMNVIVYESGVMTVNAEMEMSRASLEEVVVMGYATTRKKELTGSVTTVRGEELTKSLTGRVSGLAIRSELGEMDVLTDSIRIRGNATITGNGEPLIIIDGVPVDRMPDDLKPEDIANTAVLKDASATAIYGARGANGVIIITTKAFNPKMMREEFRDYAFWKPNLITDENGEVKFAVTYPDNITSWQTYVVGMDKQHHITKASKLVKSFKPMLAQLAAPQFLVQGDSATVIGKKINYTSSPVTATADFEVNGKKIASSSEVLKANQAGVSEFPVITVPGVDTITARFSMKAETGFADGEQRKIPVLRRGTAETIGQFNILQQDTTIQVLTNANGGPVKIYAQNNTLDVLLDEIKHLKDYQYYCMEQTASKITGLAMEKKIRQALNQDFTGQKELNKLIEKLQKGQLFDGSWSWWESGTGNTTITNYVTRALLQLRGDALLETNIRNALIYLNNQLPKMDKYAMLETLLTLSEAGHDMDYASFLKRVQFDSLTQHQQWQVMAISQKQKLDYEKELPALLSKNTRTMFGGMHWGVKGYWWNRNEIATTVLAYKTLGNMPGHSAVQERVLQYFLEQRREGYWRNTVESATILSAILPDLLKQNQQFNEKASIRISGDTSISANKFPFAAVLKPGTTNLTVQKQGGGMIYFTAYQQVFNPTPQAVDTNFKLTTTFVDTKGNTVKQLKAGQTLNLNLKVEVLKDAEYVQIEIPVPAGCTYGSKHTGSRYEHREYFRDRVLIFAEQLKTGVYNYSVVLEPRYTGSYILNPAKAELMYFPVFYGRTGINSIDITK